MNILISNDDGYQSAGILALADALDSLGDITVAAPDRDRSGASNSLTLDIPLRAIRQSNGFYKITGTPTDCVHLAITGLLDEEPDMVVSGINHGPNLGDDVIYSGTVAAATEGRNLGLPAIAISIASFEPQHLDTAGAIAKKLVMNLHQSKLHPYSILNVNVPDLPIDQLKGIQSTRLGHRHKAEPVFKSSDLQGEPVYWVGPPGPEQDAGEGTDFWAIKHNYVSVTPLKIDLTHQQQLNELTHWLNDLYD